MGERFNGIEEVVGSIPSGSTKSCIVNKVYPPPSTLRRVQVDVASGARKIVVLMSVQSLMICAPVLTQMFLDHT